MGDRGLEDSYVDRNFIRVRAHSIAIGYNEGGPIEYDGTNVTWSAAFGVMLPNGKKKTTSTSGSLAVGANEAIYITVVDWTNDETGLTLNKTAIANLPNLNKEDIVLGIVIAQGKLCLLEGLDTYHKHAGNDAPKISGSYLVDPLIIPDGDGQYLQVPKLSTTQRDALAPVNGMLIYNTTTNQFERYQAGAWGAFGGISNLSELTIDADKDWNNKKITNLNSLTLKDIDGTPIGDLLLKVLDEVLHIRNAADSAYKPIRVGAPVDDNDAPP
ncbi:MAG: hypothetical protein QME59_00480 [Candidatus Hydrothermarchaeota archaeon]|nr:hypothetical protein [Candidatus Hydrothermarchaeota archaeon]